MKLTTLSGRPITEMAYNRETFKDRIEEKLRGAIHEYFKAETADANGLTKWVNHWRSEAARLLDELERLVLRHKIRGFRDRRRAFQEVVADVREDEDYYREGARRIVCRDFKLPKLAREMPDAASQSFFQAVESIRIPR